MINYVTYKAIDREKWDACIRESRNGLPYAWSWYLDICSRHWDALILDDYQAVFPLCWHRKYGISYLYQPLYNQQLGIFSSQPVTDDLTEAFLRQIPDRFKLVEICLNSGNHPGEGDYTTTPMVTYRLDLGQDYASLNKGYHSNTRRNLNTCQDHQLQFKTSGDPGQLIRMFREGIGKKLPEVTAYHYDYLSKLMHTAMHRQAGKLIEAYLPSGELCSAGFFLYGHRMIINLFPASNETGRKNAAMTGIIDHVIRQHAGESLVLDFEGSMIPSVARFYQGFGGSPVTYYFIAYNRLPKAVKWLKR